VVVVVVVVVVVDVVVDVDVDRGGRDGTSLAAIDIALFAFVVDYQIQIRLSPWRPLSLFIKGGRGGRVVNDGRSRGENRLVAVPSGLDLTFASK
jgi:hypothetical protein